MKEQKDQKQNIKNKGITLIALVVTIVVLLILAATSISMLTGENGIITQAQDAKDKTGQASAEERVNVEVAGSFDSNGNLSIPLLNENLKKNVEGITHEGKTLDENPITSLPTIVELDGYEVEITGKGSSGGGIEQGEAGIRYEEDTKVTIGGEEVSIPGGSTISKIPGEYEDVDDGLVIYIIPKNETPNWEADEDGDGIKDVQEQYDQFVWVPVPNAIAVNMNDDKVVDATDIDLMIAQDKYPMAIAIDDTNYRGVLYDFYENGGTLTISDKSWSSTSTSSREPAYLEDSSYADGSSYNNTDPKISQSLLQSEFNEMVNKVSNNKGFWVGRYETSNMTSSNAQDKTNKIKVIRGTTTGITSVNWYRMYAQQKAYRNLTEISSTRTSSMIWGSQWDQIMIWMRNVPSEYKDTTYTGNYYVTNAVGMGNFGTINGVDDGWSSASPAPTGYSDSYKVKNIYDLAGNVHDETLEATGTSARVLRGGFYSGTSTYDTCPDGRLGIYPDRGSRNIGSRPALY